MPLLYLLLCLPMNKSLHAFLAAIFFSFCAHAGPYTGGFSLIYASNKEILKAVIPLNGTGLCTGTIVGLNPPTIITARHCAEGGAVKYNDWSPEKIIQNDFKNFTFDMETSTLPGDLAILVFPTQSQEEFQQRVEEKDLFIISKTPESIQFREVDICGYGVTGPSYLDVEGAGVLACGKNNLILKDPDLSFQEAYYFSAFKDLSKTDKAKSIHNQLQSYLGKYGPNTTVGIGALLVDPDKPLDMGEYSVTRSLVNRGDSGGPIFIRSSEGNFLIGVSSLVLSEPSSREVLAGIFWSTGIPWSQDLFQKAVNEGADIKGYNRKLFDVSLAHGQALQYKKMTITIKSKSKETKGPYVVKIQEKNSAYMKINDVKALAIKTDGSQDFVVRYKLEKQHLGKTIDLQLNILAANSKEQIESISFKAQ